jgi:hypothetical protein
MYYTAARSGHLSILESWGYTTVGALAWEMFGELREEVSINDVIVTSSAGLAIGETLTQFSSFFYRSRKSARDDVLATAFSPIKALNDWADGAEHARSEDLDPNGLTNDEWHRFEFFAGGGLTRQRSGSGRMSDGTFMTRVLPLGLYSRNAALDANGELHGDGALLAWQSTFEYSVHDYDRDGARPVDLLTILSPVGLFAEHSHRAGALRTRSRLELRGDFAGVTSYALDDYRLRHHHDDVNLQTVLKREGYYHALGVGAAVSLELGADPFDAGGRIALDSWRGIEGFDEQQQTIATEVPLADRRVEMRAWLGARVPRTPLHFEVLGRHRVRMGEVGDTAMTQRESSLYGTVGVVF